MARDFAVFTPGQGELLRRALGSKHAAKLIEGLRSAFVEGAIGRGVSAEIAEQVFEKLRGFGSYSFPKSHAAAFSVVVYQSAWLKVYHPAALACAILNNSPMGFWPPSVVVEDAKRHGIRILPVDVNRSQAACTLEQGAFRLGLLYVNSLGEASADRVITERSRKLFSSLPDFCRRTRLPKRVVTNVILAGGMDCFNTDRRRLIWELGRLRYEEEELELVFSSEAVPLQPMSPAEAFGRQYAVLGLSVDEHPMSFLQDFLDSQGILTSASLKDCKPGDQVRVAGMVVMHQAPPTARGVHFVSLEDRDGFTNVIFHPQTYERFRRVVRESRFLVVTGEVQRKGDVINIIASRAGSVTAAV